MVCRINNRTNIAIEVLDENVNKTFCQPVFLIFYWCFEVQYDVGVLKLYYNLSYKVVSL